MSDNESSNNLAKIRIDLIMAKYGYKSALPSQA